MILILLIVIAVCLILITFSIISIANTLWNIYKNLKINNYERTINRTKSMDYEKKYKELVGKIEKAYLYAQTDSTRAVLEEIRPELNESEDEKIRKWLIAQLELKSDIKNPRDLELMILKSITWLEKQGKQVPVWSEEDDKISEYIVRVFKGEISFTSEKENKKYIDWLKSLKERIGG